MQSYTEKIREIAKKLLAEKRVDMVVGFTGGTLPMTSVPFCARTPEEAETLHYDGFCGANLANYLTDRKEKIGIVARGCESRSVLNHIVENKITREQLVVIGVPCTGMVDRKKVEALYDGVITEVADQGDTLLVRGSGGEKKIDRATVADTTCAVCVHRNPVVHDELVGEPVKEQDGAVRYEMVEAVEKMSSEERWNFFEDIFSSCIRCYACRNACPLCYCPTCFVDEAKPQWVGKGQDEIDVRTFHFLRAYHCAGRCVDCGACVRACPMNINVRLLTKKLEKDCLELFNWESGMTTDKRPALDGFSSNDPGDFIK
ncbi:MAG: 4Fe-4S ferredoxin [Thermodesulfobacteriota bacterium]